MEENEMGEWVIVENNNFPDIDEDDDWKRSSSSSKLGWMLETGVSIGKNAVVTGVIISSIPILVPPLVVVAALGCAFSLPIGFVYATYACTTNLMAKLLPVPSPPPPPPTPPYYYPEGEEKQMEEAAVKDGVVTRIELVDDFDRVKVIDDEAVDDNDNNNNNNKPPFGSVGPDTTVMNAEKVDLYAAAADAEEDNNVQVEKTATVAKGKRKARKKKESAEGKGMGIVVVDGDDEKADQEEPSAGKSDDVVVVNIDDSSLLVEEHEVTVEDEEDMGELGQSVNYTSTGGANDGELKHDNDQIPGAVDGGARSDDVEHEVFVETSTVFTNDEGVVDKKIKLRSVTIYNEPAAAGGGNDNQAEAKTVADDDEVKEEKKVTRVVGDGAHSDEGLFGEDEEIRKKMEGIRAIIGYKGPKGDSYTEELKALYVFIGIEPPPDSADFQNKLRSLMSVIGLK